jgi:predicted transcriptional regulator
MEKALARKKSFHLTEGELPLMQVLWEKGRATVGDVVASLPADPQLAYSTVLTTLRILEAKGYLRHTKEGRAYVYEPIVVQEEATSKALDYLVNRFFGGSCVMLVQNLLKKETIGRAELRRIKKMIAESGQGGKK